MLSAFSREPNHSLTVALLSFSLLPRFSLLLSGFDSDIQITIVDEASGFCGNLDVDGGQEDFCVVKVEGYMTNCKQAAAGYLKVVLGTAGAYEVKAVHGRVAGQMVWIVSHMQLISAAGIANKSSYLPPLSPCRSKSQLELLMMSAVPFNTSTAVISKQHEWDRPLQSNFTTSRRQRVPSSPTARIQPCSLQKIRR